jgi:Ca-activated chloride channel homolog
MSLANPHALWLLLLLPIPLLLSTRRSERRRAVSNLFLWRAAANPDAPTLKVRSLRRQWLVALQMAIIGATVLAMARPVVASHAERVVVVFDLSASMSARDGGGTRFDAARQRALTLVAGLSSGSRVRLIAADASAHEVGEYAASDSALPRAIALLAPAAGASDMSGAVQTARRTSGGERVVIFSDHASDVGQSSEWPIVWDTVGAPVDNVAISRLVARRRPLSSSDGDVLIGVRNFAAHATRADVEITQDGQVIGRHAFAIDKDSEQTIVVDAPRIGGVIAARLAPDDSLAVDNSRIDVVPPVERIRVGFSGPKNYYVEKALAADSAIAVLPASSGLDVLVCGCDQLPPHGNILRLSDAARPLAAGSLAVVSPNHPVASDLLFAGAIARPTSGAENGETIVRAGDVPAVVAVERDGRRVVEFRFEPAAENAITTAFPILVANAIRWLDGRQGNATQIQAGEPLRWTLPEGATAVAVTGPDGKARAPQVAGRTLTVVDTRAPGVYTVRAAGAERKFAVNAVVDGESDLRTTGGASPSAASGRAFGANARPVMRFLLLVAALLVALEWLVTRRRTAWRSAIAACLLAGAAGAAVFPRTAPIDVVAVVDRSRSIPVRAQREAIARVTSAAAVLRHGDRLGMVDVGADALVSAELSGTLSPHVSASGVGDSDTDIAAGLRLAHAMLPPQRARRIVLFSDGRQTAGDAEREAAFLAADGVRVDVSRIDASGVSGTPTVVRVAAPAYARSSEPFDVAVEIKGTPGARAPLTISRDDEPVETREIQVGTFGTTTETLTDKPSSGLHVYRASLRSDDAGDTETGAVVSVSGVPSVLYVSRAAGVLQPLLATAGFRVTHVPPDAMPRSAEALLQYDSIVLDDVSADELGNGRAADIARYVEQFGGGLLLLGGPRTLDVAGYPIGALGPALPVDFRRRSGQRSPSFGLVLVFDKSGSMADQAGGASKIELARQAVMRVLDVLPPTDSLGVIAFDANPVAVTPFAPGQQATDVAKQLEAIVPSGPTRIAPAALLAVRWLNAAGARAAIARRQILLISDGQTSADDEQQLRAAIGAAGVEVSTVAIGSTANRALLQQIASSTGGRAYFPSDLADLPKIVAREAARSRSGQVVEEPFVLRGSPHPIMAGIDRASLPMLSGYVVGAAKPSALSVLASHLDDPILGVWQFGLGRVAVFTAGLESSWSAQLRAWRGSGRLWVQTARWASRGLDDRELRLAVTREGTTLRFVLDAAREDGRPLALTDIRAALRSPDDKTNDLRFDALAPGQYAASTEATVAGAYTLSFSARDRENGAEHHFVSGVFRGDEQERASSQPDDGMLGRLAAITGGRVLSPSESPFAPPRPTSYQDVSVWIAAAALSLYLAEMLVGPWLVPRLTSSAASTSRSQGRSRRPILC